MQLVEAVTSHLGDDTSEPQLAAALRLMCRELGVERFSLLTFDRDDSSFRVVAGAGSQVLAPGTVLPLETSTQVAVAAGGDVFRHAPFGTTEPFERSVDQLVLDMGFRSGCSIPLYVGSRPVGTLCALSRLADFDCDPILDAMHDVSMALAVGVSGPRTSEPRVLVCVDDELCAEGIARVVERSIGARAEICATQEEALSGPRTGYEVVICDATFDGQPVDAFLAALRGAGAHAPALVVATHDTRMSRCVAARSGASGYIARGGGSAAIGAAVQGIVSGRADGLIGEHALGAAGVVPQLTPQEARVLRLLERGLRFKQIASDLDITESTAKGHARNLFAKLDAHSRSEAVYEARRHGLLDFLN
jgi:DNA-binding NarL/FixJ family response regulator